MTYGGKSTVRDRSSGTSSSVAFTPLQVKKMGLGSFRYLLMTVIVNNINVLCRDWRSWTRRLQRRRWLKQIRNTFLTWPSSSKSRRSPRCDHPPPLQGINTVEVSQSVCFPFLLFAVLLKCQHLCACSYFADVEICICLRGAWDHHNSPLAISQKYLLKFLQSRF